MVKVCPTSSVSHTEPIIGLSGKFSAVVWAQGLNQTKSFLETSEDDWYEIMEANFHFVRKTVKILVNEQLVQRPASFVFISSIWGDYAKNEKSSYVASKSALQGLTRSLAIELAPLGIRVNSVLPGIVDNSMTQSNLSLEQIKKVESETPGGRLITPLEIARIVKFFCSDESIGINGQSITVDNGWTIARYI
jgi:NAD(P)-dependent dehydrogenase (short-subunit alcohol dehydrogenase family)